MDNSIKRAYESIEFPDELRSGILEGILAGGERKEARVMKKTGRTKKTAAVIAAAVAALAMTVTAGAAAYKAFFHKESVASFGIESAVKDDSTAGAASAENAHMRVTADTVLSDGYTTQMVFTVEALDDTGREYLGRKEKNKSIIPIMYYSEEAEKLEDIWAYSRSGGAKVLQAGTYNQKFSDSLSPEPRLNSDGALAFACFNYFGNDNPGKIYVTPEDDKALEPDGYYGSVFEGIILELDVSKNVETKEFRDGDNRLILSQTGISVLRGEKGSPLYVSGNIMSRFRYDDGTTEDINGSGGMSVLNEDHCYSFFRRTVDIGRVTSVLYANREYK